MYQVPYVALNPTGSAVLTTDDGFFRCSQMVGSAPRVDDRLEPRISDLACFQALGVRRLSGKRRPM